jgi:hypothetical protein
VVAEHAPCTDNHNNRFRNFIGQEDEVKRESRAYEWETKTLKYGNFHSSDNQDNVKALVVLTDDEKKVTKHSDVQFLCSHKRYIFLIFIKMFA